MNPSSFRLLLLRFALLPILCVCLFVGILSWQFHEIDLLRTQTTQATTLTIGSDRLLNSLVDEETGVRGFALSGNAAFLQPYHAATDRIDDELDAIANAADGKALVTAELHEIRQDIASFDKANEAIVSAVPAHIEDADALLAQKQAMDRLRTRIRKLENEQSALRQQGRQKLLKMYAAQPVVAIVGGALVAIFLVLDGIGQFRKLSRAFAEQLREVEIQRNSLSTTLRSIGDAVIVCDQDGKITLLNPTAEELTGWSSLEAVGEHLDAVFPIVNETSRKKVESPVAKVLRTGQIVGLANHTVLIRRDGSEIAIDDSGAPIRGEKDGIAGVVLVFRDIAERRKAERELALRNAELESLLHNSPIGFATFDTSYHYLRVNKALSDIDGIAEEAHLGKPLSEMMPEAFPVLQPLLDSVLREGKVIQREFIGRRPQDEGERQWLTWFYPVFAGESTKPVLAGAIILDNTDRWHAHEALVRTEKLAAVGRLAASIAHEMNNPLTSVTNLLYLIGYDQALSESTRGFVERASIELDRVSKIATQTLRFARRTMNPAQVNLEEIVSGLMLLFGGRLNQSQITVNIRKRSTSTFIGYASEIMQLLTNLLGNAIDAIGTGGRITLATQSSTHWSTETSCVAVSVADSGPGIPENLRKKIWEPFFTTKADTGTGLGLWLVEETIRKNGGWIRMRTTCNEVRHGTVFRLLLPLEMPQISEDEATVQGS
ncbi:PAS domain-containing protein [Acidicapsa dinghuensis]|uniref:histidine kinase n=1 Tax=Acidicapsa dinghuensis TaxID=2218256 RepID=A0ABW1EFF7_9BACT|nr:PAS domain-containing protein [Acidicapsa dinghuensis]